MMAVLSIITLCILFRAGQSYYPSPPSDINLFVATHVFHPTRLNGTNLNKAAESLTDAQCAGSTIIHQEIAQCNSSSLSDTYIIPHQAIYHDGERCGAGTKKDYTIMVRGSKLADARTAVINGIGPLYGILSSNARAFNAFEVLGGLELLHVGIEYTAARVCGGQEKFALHTVYFFILPTKIDLNFGFAYLGVNEVGMVSVKTDEQLCLYKQSRNTGPGQSPFTTPTPSPVGMLVNFTKKIYDLEDPPDMRKCFPVGEVGNPSSPSPRPQPTIVVEPTPTTNVTTTPTVTVSLRPSPTKAANATATPGGVSNSQRPSSTPSPTKSKGISPTPSKTPEPSDDGDVCFPSSATVQLDTGARIAMSLLRVGDKVLVEDGKYSEVFLFTHHTNAVRSRFIGIKVATGDELVLSPMHYIPVRRQLKAAHATTRGDIVTLGNGSETYITEKRELHMWGLHNPQTMDGTIVVNGILASTFTQIVRPSTAMGLLAPIKFWYNLRVWNAPLEKAFKNGNNILVRLLPRGSFTW